MISSDVYAREVRAVLVVAEERVVIVASFGRTCQIYSICLLAVTVLPNVPPVFERDL